MTDSVDVDVALRRVVVGYRVVGAVWLWLLAAIALATEDVEVAVVVGSGLLALAWTVATVTTAARRPALFGSVPWVAVDIAVSIALIYLGTRSGAARSFFGGYPFSTVLVAALCLRLPGAITTAVALSVASFALLGANEAVTSTLVYVAGAGVVAWGMDLIRRNDADRRALEQRLAAEQAERARSQERAETGAALHDSVLQTLALIQRRSDDGGEVTALARRQERELREWLSGIRTTLGAAGATTLAASLAEIVETIEADGRMKVDLVTVGDAPLDERLEAVVAATGEALRNTLGHAGVAEASVYAEVGGGAVSVFVRDRGAGFDPDAVPGDRHGIRESIVGRLERHGGTATIRTAPGAGTEVELHIGLD